MASPPTPVHLPVECSVVAPAVEFPVEPGLTVSWTGLEETQMASYMSTSVFGWAFVRVPVEAMALELEQACLRPFRAANPDPG